MASLWDKFPFEVVTKIAVELEHIDPMGPPNAHLSLLTTSQRVYDALRGDSTFLSTTYRIKYDLTAPKRRYGPRASKNSNQIKQLKRNTDTLTAFRHHRLDDVDDDTLLPYLWQVFVMLSEDDGKNRAQLQWAGVPDFVDRFVQDRNWAGSDGWPKDVPVCSLILWIMWMIGDSARLQTWSEAFRERVLDLTRPYVMMSVRYPAFHLPDNHFTVPIDPCMEGHFPTSMETAHGDWPHYRNAEDITHDVPTYGGHVKLVVPLISIAARLLFVSARELVPLAVPDTLYRDRAHATAMGNHNIIPTQADIHEVNYSDHARLRRPTDWDWLSNLPPDDRQRELSGLSAAPSIAPSSQYDNDFMRLMYCNDGFNAPIGKGRVYTHGSISGKWAGRMNIPSENQYQDLMQTAQMPALFGDDLPFATTGPVYMSLKEFVCQIPEPAAPLGLVYNNAVDDGIMNGWFSEGTRFTPTRGGLDVSWNVRGMHSHYKPYVPSHFPIHEAGDCAVCAPRPEPSLIGIETEPEDYSKEIPVDYSDEEEDDECDDEPMDEDLLPRPRPRIGGGYTDAHDPDVRRTEVGCDGLTDVILHGDTEYRHGMAWHFYRYYGRVRPWDGLITIVREPHDQRQGRFIARGYIVGGDVFVGAWRCWNQDGMTVPWEGTFIMSRVE